jgi:hypothetical protein
MAFVLLLVKETGMEAWVVVADGMGLLVGEFAGCALWSKLDAFGERCVITYPDEAAAWRHLAALGFRPGQGRFRLAPVIADIPGGHASRRALIRAGLGAEVGTLAAAAGRIMPLLRRPDPPPAAACQPSPAHTVSERG